LTLPTILSKFAGVTAFASLHSINTDVTFVFPLVFAIALLGCVLGTLLTKAEDDAVLKEFYRRVRPWGFWGPIKDKVLADDPAFEPNPDFLRDMFNVVVGICWQVALVALPIYIVIRNSNAWIAFAVVAVTSVILKFTWYDHLRKIETHMTAYETRIGKA
jgi:hypothetical protein